MIASQRGHVDVVRLLIANIDVEVLRENKLDEACLKNRKNPIARLAILEIFANSNSACCVHFLKEKTGLGLSEWLQKNPLSLEIIRDSQYAVWTCLVQSDDDQSQVSSIIRDYVERFPELYEAKDVRGVLCLDLASPCHKLAIMSIFLWFGRYRIIDQRPEHVSASCFVYKAIDEMSTADGSHNSVVAMKLMRYQSHFLCELNARKYNLDPLLIMNVLASYPVAEDILTLPVDVFANDELFSSSMPTLLNKTLAENMYCLVMPWAERNMFVALKQERFAGKDMDEVRYIFPKYCDAPPICMRIIVSMRT
jgi:hypothetical protein